MSQSKNFTYEDIICLKQIPITISKMDEVMDIVKDYFEKKIGELSKYSSRSSHLKDSSYINYFDVKIKNKYEFTFGTGFCFEDDFYLSFYIYFLNDKNNNYLNYFYDNLKKIGWEKEKTGKVITITKSEKVSKFIIENEEQIPTMVKYLKNRVDEIYDLNKNGKIKFLNEK